MNRVVKLLSSDYAKELKQRVARGAKWLDKEKPGWEKKIKPTKLEMDHGLRCVMGQVFTHHYSEGAEMLENSTVGQAFDGTDEELAAHYGFNMTSREENELDDEGGVELAWSYLAEVWIDAADKRKEKART